MTELYPNPCYNGVCHKGTVLYFSSTVILACNEQNMKPLRKDLQIKITNLLTSSLVQDNHRLHLKLE